MITPNTFNAGDPSQVADRKEKLVTGRERELLDVKLMVTTRPGRRFFWRYLQIAGVFRISFDGSSRTYFNEGERNIGLKLMADLMEAAPEQYLLMQQEAKEDLKNG